MLTNSGENEEDIIKKEKEDIKPKFTIFDIEEAQRKIFTSSSIDVAMLEGRDQSRYILLFNSEWFSRYSGIGQWIINLFASCRRLTKLLRS